MTRDQLLAVARRELEHHDFTYFTKLVPGAPTGGITTPGCAYCQLQLNTTTQFKRHLADDVPPGIVNMILSGGEREPGDE
jgi:hypothetical protein